MYKEYPKALYRNGEHRAVISHEQEVDARQDGWADWSVDYAAMNAPKDEPTKEQIETILGVDKPMERPKLSIAKR